MKVLCLFFLLVASPARADVSGDYVQFLLGQTKASRALRQKFKKKDSSLCPRASRKSGSECFGEYMKTHAVKSSTEAVLLQVLAVSEAIKEKKKGREAKSFLQLLDNLIILFSGMDLRQFYLNEYEDAVTPDETLVLEELKKDDEKILRKLQRKTKNLIAEKMPKILSQARIKEKVQLKEKEKQLNALLEQEWTYPSLEAVKAPEETTPYALKGENASRKSMDIAAFCESGEVKTCFKYEFSQCFQAVLKLQRSCQSQTRKDKSLKKCVLGIFVRQSAVSGKMVADEKCKVLFPPEF